MPRQRSHAKLQSPSRAMELIHPEFQIRGSPCAHVPLYRALTAAAISISRLPASNRIFASPSLPPPLLPRTYDADPASQPDSPSQNIGSDQSPNKKPFFATRIRPSRPFPSPGRSPARASNRGLASAGSRDGADPRDALPSPLRCAPSSSSRQALLLLFVFVCASEGDPYVPPFLVWISQVRTKLVSDGVVRQAGRGRRHERVELDALSLLLRIAAS